MTKVTMPEPFTYPPDDWVKGFFDEPNECGFYSFYGDFGNIAYRFQRAAQASNLITTDQAEAYANARVREALEKVESMLTTMYTYAVKARVPEAEDEQGWNASCADRAIAIGEAVLAIRAMLPSLSEALA